MVGLFTSTFTYFLLIMNAAATKLKYSWLCYCDFNIFMWTFCKDCSYSELTLQDRHFCACIAQVNFMKQRKYIQGK